MARLPKRAAESVAAGLEKFHPILTAPTSHDANESDSVAEDL